MNNGSININADLMITLLSSGQLSEKEKIRVKKLLMRTIALAEKLVTVGEEWVEQ